MIDLTSLKAYCLPAVDVWIIEARDISLVDCAFIPVMVEKAGLKIIFKKVVRRNESRNVSPF